MSDIEQLKQQLIDTGAWLYQKGWCPLTMGNISARMDQRSLLLTQSNQPKGCLAPHHITTVDLDGNPFKSNSHPDTQSLVHAMIYRRFLNLNFIIHSYSIYSNVFGRALWQSQLIFKNYGIQALITGIEKQDQELRLPIVPNSANSDDLVQAVDSCLSSLGNCPAFIIAGQGLYSWGETEEEARRHCETLELLLETEYKSCLLLK